jgi:hypothetical protein
MPLLVVLWAAKNGHETVLVLSSIRKYQRWQRLEYYPSSRSGPSTSTIGTTRLKSDVVSISGCQFARLNLSSMIIVNHSNVESFNRLHSSPRLNRRKPRINLLSSQIIIPILPNTLGDQTFHRPVARMRRPGGLRFWLILRSQPHHPPQRPAIAFPLLCGNIGQSF